MFKKIKIFSLSTNNYSAFNKKFLESFSNYFLPQIPKEFIIFTDDVNNEVFRKFNVKTHYIEHEKWPFITLKKFEYITSLKDEINDEDFCFSVDIDLEVISLIEFLSVNNLVCVQHPGNYLINMKQSLEDNANSTAYINIQNLPENYQYAQGCLWGGSKSYFIDLVETLYSNTKKDLERGIIAKWHDESHLNKYIINNLKHFNMLNSSFAYPENWDLPLNKYIIHREKDMIQYPRFQGDK